MSDIVHSGDVEKTFTVIDEKTFADKINNDAVDVNASINSIEKTFLEIIQGSLTSLIIQDKLMKTSINLTPDLIEIINKILSISPDNFNDVEKAVSEIMKDGKIDSKDIPQFIIVVQKIYQLVHSIKHTKFDAKKRSEITGSVLKFIVHLLVLERKIKVDQEKEAQFLTDCDVLIDSCIGLLSFPKSIKTKGCLKKLFG